uniref:Uncharacterized protein n=1 Tax=Amphilophus citrinellus TaxID=61819 RepID=A0A3Q0S3V8_AMPCI
MSAATCQLSEDQFLCSICLDVFTHPVSTPCGHNFCKSCITQHWDINFPYRCPLCKKVFYVRPELQVNTLIAEVSTSLRLSAQQEARGSGSERQHAKPGEVPCDVCSGTKLKALKSCLVCLASYCETHLEPHQTVSGLKKHQLIDPVKNLEGRICSKHDKLLELYCKTDQTCVCMLCAILDHKTHDVVPLKEECEEKKAELKLTQDQVQAMILKKEAKIQGLRSCVELSKKAADRQIAEGVRIYTALRESVEKGLNELIEAVDEKQRTAEKQAEGFIKQLEQEIIELTKRSSEVEQLSRSEDHLQFIQNFSSMKAASAIKDRTESRLHPPSFEGMVTRAVSQVEKMLSKQMKIQVEADLRRVRQYAVDVTLDPDTANPKLVLSEDGKLVNKADKENNVPDNPEKLSVCTQQSFSSGRFYYEVEVKGKTEWALGVAGESVSRKGDIPPSPQSGCWTICLRHRNEHFAAAAADADVHLCLRAKPEKVGVFVDYEEGVVSFYDADAAALIYSFTGCCFTEKLFPYFSPGNNDGGNNSTPLIISPVNHPE